MSTGNGASAARAIASRSTTIGADAPSRSGSAVRISTGHARRSSAARTPGAARVAAIDRTVRTRFGSRPPPQRPPAPEGANGHAGVTDGDGRLGAIRRVARKDHQPRLARSSRHVDRGRTAPCRDDRGQSRGLEPEERHGNRVRVLSKEPGNPLQERHLVSGVVAGIHKTNHLSDELRSTLGGGRRACCRTSRTCVTGYDRPPGGRPGKANQS